MVVCLEQGADLHMAQLMPLPLTVSCFSKIQIGFTFLVPAHLRSPGKGPLNVCLCSYSNGSYRPHRRCCSYSDSLSSCYAGHIHSGKCNAPVCPQKCPFPWGSGPPSNTWFLGPTRVGHSSDGISWCRSVYPFLQGSWPTDTQSIEVIHTSPLCQ